jgi:hypothetical protein
MRSATAFTPGMSRDSRLIGLRHSAARPRIPIPNGDETSVVKMHSGNGEHDEMDRHAIACFDRALADVGLASDNALRQVLHHYFAWSTTVAMSRYHQSASDVPTASASHGGRGTACRRNRNRHDRSKRP